MNVTNKEIEAHVRVVNVLYGRSFEVDSYRPNQVRLYQLVEGGKQYAPHRMTHSQFVAFLDGLITAWEIRP